MAHHVFIDTNMLLSLYDYTDDDLQKLQSLAAAVEDKKVVVFLPEQVVSEFSRNRDSKIAAIIDQLEQKFRADGSLPRICDEFEESTTVSKSAEALAKAKNALLAVVKKKAKERDLAADHLIRRIIAASRQINVDAPILEKARVRRDVGKAPGKRETLGDQINWEALLAGVEAGTPLYVLTRDNDWRSKLTGELHNQLALEWKAEKKAVCTLLDRINKLLALLDLGIEVESETEGEKDVVVSMLCESGSYWMTHRTIQDLSGYKSFNEDQVDRMVKAFTRNSQIHGIGSDEDVSEFYSGLLKRYSAQIDARDATDIRVFIGD